jgi:hypothetical protein
MSRNIPVNLRHKHHSTARQTISRDVAITILRTGAILCWTAALGLLGVVALGVIRSRSAPGMPGWEPPVYGALCVAATVIGCRLWALRRWACIAAVVGAWLFCLLEPWRPSHWPGGQVEPVGAIASCLMAAAMLAVPMTIAWVMGRSKLRSGL